MLCFVIRNGRLQAAQKSIPKLRRGWALIRMRLAGICNTDLEILRGYHNFRGTPGHEFVGEVVEVGAPLAAKKRWLGKRVAGEINLSCSAYGYRPLCEFCRRGLRTHCIRRTVLGIVAHDGALADYLTLPLENLHVVPANVADEKAVFVEPLAAACEILEQIAIHDFSRVAVLGDGKLGQLIALVLKTTGARVVLYGKHENKLAVARRAGIRTRKIRGAPHERDHLRKNYRLVVEATGSPTGLALALQMTQPRGTVVLKSTFHGAAPVETWPIVVKEVTVLGSRCGPFAPAISLLRSGKVDPTPLISHTFPLSETSTAIAYAQRPGILKVLLRGNSLPPTNG